MDTERSSTGFSCPHSAIRTPRQTPYSRTPLSRRLGHSAHRQLGKSKATSKTKPSFQGLVNKTWKLYRLSPLCKFSANPHSFCNYAKSLSISIAELQRADILSSSKNLHRSIFSLYKSLKESEDDPVCIQIIITGITKQDVRSTLLTALLMGVGMKVGELVPARSKHFVHYPILMVKGAATLSKALQSWLESKFDCKVSPMNFTSLDLSWMAAMWSGLSSGAKSKPVELLYSVPDDVTGLNKITYTIDADDCQNLWNCIHPSDSNIFTEDEMDAFMSCLQSHFYACFKVKLSAMSLVRVGTPVAYVGNEGRLKIFAERHVIPILRYITELSTEKSKMLCH